MRSALTFNTVRQLALVLDGVEEGTSYGTPAFRVHGKLFARLHQDGKALVLKMDRDEREILIEAEPTTFFVTDHYRDYDWVLVRLGAVTRPQLAGLLQDAREDAATRRRRR